MVKNDTGRAPLAGGLSAAPPTPIDGQPKLSGRECIRVLNELISEFDNVTDETKLILEREGFHFECRGEINVKGKGLMTTYLLRSEESRRGTVSRRRRSSAVPPITLQQSHGHGMMNGGTC
ncbi:hypothetical protein niasHT_026336 [Heterodera trifolii]|uniref:adenylate cyclase n=1 Tax=Heterodera trifolii TaxID=157864 RepID=A0ABD2K147_9BILA